MSNRILLDVSYVVIMRRLEFQRRSVHSKNSNYSIFAFEFFVLFLDFEIWKLKLYFTLSVSNLYSHRIKVSSFYFLCLLKKLTFDSNLHFSIGRYKLAIYSSFDLISTMYWFRYLLNSDWIRAVFTPFWIRSRFGFSVYNANLVKNEIFVLSYIK